MSSQTGSDPQLRDSLPSELCGIVWVAGDQTQMRVLAPAGALPRSHTPSPEVWCCDHGSSFSSKLGYLLSASHCLVSAL